jgi:zeaxanthin epoxidase
MSCLCYTGSYVGRGQSELVNFLLGPFRQQHEGWSEEIMTVLDATPPESVEQRDLYDRRPELFRSWADGNVVLMGDAVHSMMPNLGEHCSR